MLIGIVMTIHNRPALTLQSLDNLRNTQRPEGHHLLCVLVDDCSGEETKEVIAEFNWTGVSVLKLRNGVGFGVKNSLRRGIEMCWDLGCELVTNLDNDVKLKPEWLEKLLELHIKWVSRISTAFHSTTRNANGSERHKITKLEKDWCIKESVGGINMMFTQPIYEACIQPALESEVGNWDHMACLNAGWVACTIPSYIQHTGTTESTLGHSGEEPDTADGFFNLDLPDVTLICIDSLQPELARKAIDVSKRDITFADVVFLSPEGLDTKEKYSRFVIRELHNHFKTSHCLIVQHDGYVLNPEAWNPEWLRYDYIGATWGYKDGNNVGNGGFSLRSRKLMQEVALFDLTKFHPEDYVICRSLRPLLEFKGFVFAPEEEANKFSIEAYGAEAFPGANRYNAQFGFHGWNVDFSGAHMGHVPRKPETVLSAHAKRYAKLNRR